MGCSGRELGCILPESGDVSDAGFEVTLCGSQPSVDGTS